MNIHLIIASSNNREKTRGASDFPINIHSAGNLLCIWTNIVFISGGNWSVDVQRCKQSLKLGEAMHIADCWLYWGYQFALRHCVRQQVICAASRRNSAASRAAWLADHLSWHLLVRWNAPPYLIAWWDERRRKFLAAIKSDSPKEIFLLFSLRRRRNDDDGVEEETWKRKTRLLKSLWLDELFDVFTCINFHSLGRNCKKQWLNCI